MSVLLVEVPTVSRQVDRRQEIVNNGVLWWPAQLSRLVTEAEETVMGVPGGGDHPQMPPVARMYMTSRDSESVSVRSSQRI